MEGKTAYKIDFWFLDYRLDLDRTRFQYQTDLLALPTYKLDSGEYEEGDFITNLYLNGDFDLFQMEDFIHFIERGDLFQSDYNKKEKYNSLLKENPHHLSEWEDYAEVIENRDIFIGTYYFDDPANNYTHYNVLNSNFIHWNEYRLGDFIGPWGALALLKGQRLNHLEPNMAIDSLYNIIKKSSIRPEITIKEGEPTFTGYGYDFNSHPYDCSVLLSVDKDGVFTKIHDIVSMDELEYRLLHQHFRIPDNKDFA